MTTKQFVTLEKSLLPEFAGFAIKGKLMFIPPARHILRGINFEGSDFSKTSFFVTRFVIPLCVPTKYLYFLLCDRIRDKGKGDGWDANMPNLFAELTEALKLQALPFLSEVETLPNFITVLMRSHGSDHAGALEPMGYAYARMGYVDNAIDALDRLLARIDRLDPKAPWDIERSERAKLLKAKLISGPAEAQQQLDVWEAESIRNLGLEEFR
jgi:hypothetical protein